MRKRLTWHAEFLALALAAICPMATPAAALDPALARLCRDKAIAAYPTKPAGSSSGHAQAQRDFIKECIAKDGKIDAPPPPEEQGAADAAKKTEAPAVPPAAAH